VDIQRQALAVGSIAAVIGLDELKPPVQLHQRQVGFTGDDQVVEVVALVAHRHALENRRAAHPAQQPGQRIQTGDEILFARSIAAQAEQHRYQRHPRSISTPRALARALTPGLVTRSRNQAIPNSAIRSAARRSAKVSTSSKRAASAKRSMAAATLA